MLPQSTDVLIVGAGPTGLALAIALRQAGVDHVIIDALAHGQNTSRAAVIHSHTLEALETLGVVGALTAQGLQLSRFTIRDGDQPLLGIGFDALPSLHKELLMVPQSTTESVLAARLTAHDGQLYRGVTAIAAERGGRGAAVRVRTDEGERTIETRFVVGADGMHSIVREAAGIGFKGEAYEGSFILADVRMDWPLGADEVSLFFSPAGLVVVAPLPDRLFRIVASIEEAPEVPAVEDVQRLLDARGPSAVSRVREVVWGSRFRVHHRLADTYRSGPFLLMGDAAHVHSPAGGQGMNTGLVDAVVLGRALARLVHQGDSEAVLDDYARIRRMAAEEVLTLAGRLTRLALMRSAPLRTVRNRVFRVLNKFEPFKRRLAMSLSGLSRKSLSELSPGTPSP